MTIQADGIFKGSQNDESFQKRDLFRKIAAVCFWEELFFDLKNRGFQPFSFLITGEFIQFFLIFCKEKDALIAHFGNVQVITGKSFLLDHFQKPVHQKCCHIVFFLFFTEKGIAVHRKHQGHHVSLGF